MAFRREMDRWFEDTFGRGALTPWPGAQGVDMRLDVSETEKEFKVTAELPGVDQKDVDVTLTDDLLTIKGEKKIEDERKDDNYHSVERAYGSFARSLRLPFSADPEDVDAKFDKGVLTISVKKPAEAQKPSKKIEIKPGA